MYSEIEFKAFLTFFTQIILLHFLENFVILKKIKLDKLYNFLHK